MRHASDSKAKPAAPAFDFDALHASVDAVGAGGKVDWDSDNSGWWLNRFSSLGKGSFGAGKSGAGLADFLADSRKDFDKEAKQNEFDSLGNSLKSNRGDTTEAKGWFDL